MSSGIDAAKTFLTKLFGPAAEEVGLIFQERVRLYRIKNLLRVLDKAEGYLIKAGRTPKEIPLRTLSPLLEGASLEDNEALSDKWAALIANSASGEHGVGPHPSYPRILQELSPLDAAFLDRLEKKRKPVNWPDFRAQMSSDLSISPDDANRVFDNLMRLWLAYNKGGKGYGLSSFGKDFLKACSPPTTDS